MQTEITDSPEFPETLKEPKMQDSHPPKKLEILEKFRKTDKSMLRG